jgi:hypothetical protein
VFLDYFKDKSSIIANLRSGDNLQMANEYLSATVDGKLTKVVRFFKAFIEKINNLQQLGYEYSNSFIRFIDLWQGKSDKKILISFCLKYISLKHWERAYDGIRENCLCENLY